MIQSQPPKENRFTGDDSQDFESFMTQFELATTLDGVTDQMIFGELKFWVAGNAKIAVTQYDNEKDHSEALRKAKAHLRREYGQRVLTARQMLDSLLTGGKLDQKDTEGICGLIVKLEQVHQRAIETDRERTFSTRETFKDILSKKLPFFTHKWAKIIENTEERRFYDSTIKELDFNDFIRYLRKSNKILMCKASLSDAPAPSPKDGSGNKGAKNSKVAATSSEIAATGAEVASTSRPKPKGPPVGGNGNQKKSFSSAVKQSGNGTTEVTSSSAVKTNSSSAASGNCLACKNGKHDLDCCTEFLKKSKPDRKEFAKSNGLCYLCLAHGHMVSQCTEDVKCKECNKKHHSVFHREKTEEEAI